VKDKWYGDKRDLVKWGSLLQIARLHGASRILQVPYFRPSSWGTLEIDGEDYPISNAVVEHFRNIYNIKKMTAWLRIDIIMTLFSGRDTYMQEILRAVGNSKGNPCVVFLDPDTGLEPRKPNLTHVLEEELAQIWRAMPGNDILVLYQHQTNRRGEPWIEPKRAQFEQALDLAPGASKLAHGPKIISDVVLFYCQKRPA